MGNLKIINPSNYERKEDIIEIEFDNNFYDKLKANFNLKSKDVILNLENQNHKYSIDAQIDDIDFLNQKKRLSFLMESLKPSFDHDYKTPSDEYKLSLNNYDGKNNPLWFLDFREESGKVVAFDIGNESLRIHFRLLNGYASSVKLYDTEILNGNPNPPPAHYKYLKCMQINKITINSPSWWCSSNKTINLENINYTIINSHVGTVKPIISLATDPFEIERERCTYLGTNENPFYGRLYRTFSLYKGRNFLTEEIYLLLNKDKNGLLNHDGLKAQFGPHYHTWLNYGCYPPITQYEEVPDWFLINSIFVNYGYGFGTDTHVEGKIYQDNNNGYFWNLEPAENHKCIHFFMKQGNYVNHFQKINAEVGKFTHYIGHQWYETILKPVRAQFIM